MSREDAITVEGTIVEVLPNTVYRVVLANGHRVLTHVSGKMRLTVSSIGLGDRVVVEMSPYDLSTGRLSADRKELP